MDDGVPVWFIIFGFIVITFIAIVVVSIVIKSIKYRRDVRNAVQERIDVKVSSKRLQTSGGGQTMASTWYYVTFERVSSGDRFELSVLSKDYAMIAEGDFGVLEHRGPKFISFERAL